MASTTKEREKQKRKQRRGESSAKREDVVFITLKRRLGDARYVLGVLRQYSGQSVWDEGQTRTAARKLTPETEIEGKEGRRREKRKKKQSDGKRFAVF